MGQSFLLRRESNVKCDQIGRFIVIWATFKSLLWHLFGPHCPDFWQLLGQFLLISTNYSLYDMGNILLKLLVTLLAWLSIFDEAWNDHKKNFFSKKNIFATQNILFRGGSPGLVVTGDDLCPGGHGFESSHHILDELDIFSYLFVVKIVLFAWKRTKINEKRPGLAHFEKNYFFFLNFFLWVFYLCDFKPRFCVRSNLFYRVKLMLKTQKCSSISLA